MQASRRSYCLVKDVQYFLSPTRCFRSSDCLVKRWQFRKSRFHHSCNPTALSQKSGVARPLPLVVWQNSPTPKPCSVCPALIPVYCSRVATVRVYRGFESSRCPLLFLRKRGLNNYSSPSEILKIFLLDKQNSARAPQAIHIESDM